jgi:AcrR family transcriptional regulator
VNFKKTIEKSKGKTVVKQKKFPERKEQILKAAERVFAKKGFHEATISEISKEAKVSDATIYEYFSNKEDLLFSIPGSETQRGKVALENNLKYMRGAANKLRGFIYHQLMFYQNNPEWAAVVMLILKQHRKYLKTDTYQIIRQWSRIITQIVEEGIDSGEFKTDTNPYLVRSVILGTIEHAVISHLLIGRYKNLMELVDPLTDLVIAGIRKNKKLKDMNIKIIVDPDQE